MVDGLIGDVPWSELVPGVRAAYAAHKHRHIIQRAWKTAVHWMGAGRPGILMLGRSGVGKSVFSAKWKGDAGETSFELPAVSPDKESEVIPFGEWTEIVTVVPGQTSRERDIALTENFGNVNGPHGVIYVADWGYSEVREPVVVRSMIADDGLDTLEKVRDRNLKLELDDFADVCRRIRESISTAERPKWLLIAINKVDLYFDRLSAAEEYYHPRFASPFTQILESQLLKAVGRNNIKISVVPINVWEKDFVWNGQTAKTSISDKTISNGLFRHFLTTLTNLSESV